MRTSDRLPEECREEIRAKAKAVKESFDRAMRQYPSSHHGTRLAGWSQCIAWVLGEDDQ